MNVIGFVDE